jgi:outer membrane protein OmpA-like peptidoglycan-associated protein
VKKKNPGASRPKLTIVHSNGRMTSTSTPRPSVSKSVSSLPTRIYFSRGSSTPTGSSLTTLRRYAEWLARSRARGLLVVGHANLRLQDRPSGDLADARARAIRDLLVWLGAHKSQVRRVSPSQLHRIRRDTTASLRAHHRSVELIVAPTASSIAQRAMPPRRRAPVRVAARR